MVNYTPKKVKQQKDKEITIKDMMLRVFTSFTEDMNIVEASKYFGEKKYLRSAGN